MLKGRHVKEYLWMAFMFGIIGLVDGVAALFGFTGFIYDIIISVIGFLFFVFNIFVLISFVQDNLDVIYLVLPIYHIFSYIFLFSLGIFLSLKELLSGNVLIILSVVGMITSAFEILFSFFLLKRGEFPQ